MLPAILPKLSVEEMGRSRKLNILFVLPQISMGGTERVVLDLARGLDKSIFNVFGAYFRDGALHEDFEEACKGLFFVSKMPGFDVKAMWQLSKIMVDSDIDIINAHHYMPFFYAYMGSKILQKRRLVYTEHSVQEVKSIRGLHEYICRLLFHRIDAVVGVSSEIATAFKDTFPHHSNKIVMIPNAVNVTSFNKSIDRNYYRTVLGLLPDHFVIGMVANFRKVKNHLCLLHAFQRLHLVHDNVRLVFVGTGFPGDTESSEDDCRNFIVENKLTDKVILTGYREDIPQLLQTFDVFCLPSFSEGLPVSVLEAMVSRVPVVGSDVEGIREVVYDHETGLLFPSNDASSLHDTLNKLLEDPALRQLLIQRAFAFVSTRHNFMTWISAYEQLFQNPDAYSRAP